MQFGKNTDSCRRKGNISGRVIFMNMSIMALFLVIIILFTMYSLNHITGTTSVRLANIHSLEASKSFNAYTAGDLALLNRLANTPAVKEWFSNESDNEKRQRAFYELLASTESPDYTSFYFGIIDSQNEYFLNATTSIEYFVPRGQMNANDPVDAWFFDLLHSEKDFLFNLTADKVTLTGTLWINHRVVYDDRTVGVLATSLNIDSILYSIFKDYDEGFITGYFVDNMGYIRAEAALLEHSDYRVGELVHISILCNHLSEFINNFVAQSDRFFTSHIRPEIIPFSGDTYSYASLTPLANSDWFIVVLFSENALFGNSELAFLIIALILALILYVLVSTFVMRRHVLKPLTNLAEEVLLPNNYGTAFKETNQNLKRNDEIGVLARNINQSQKELRSREVLLKTVNQAALTMLAIENDSELEDALSVSMEIIGRCLYVDRVYLLRCDFKTNNVDFSLISIWRSYVCKDNVPPEIMGLSLSSYKMLERLFGREHFNGPVSKLSPEEQEVLSLSGEVKSSAIIPLFVSGQPWGFFCVDDCESERTLSEGEMDVLHSAGLMFASIYNKFVQKNLANTDALTGLYNKRYFMEIAERELKDCKQKCSAFSVIMADIDLFKSVNDTYGHAIGDEVLKIFTARLSRILKEGTVLARYGGEEFVISLPHVDHKDALKTAWRLQQHTDASVFQTNGLEIKVTASFGVATSKTNPIALAELINKADLALYQAKESGRNTVAGFDENEPGK